jgi:hypothetical protein
MCMYAYNKWESNGKYSGKHPMSAAEWIRKNLSDQRLLLVSSLDWA